MKNQDIVVEPDPPSFREFQKKIGQDMQDLAFAYRIPTWNNLKIDAHFILGVFEGVIQSISDAINFAWNLITNFHEQVKALLDSVEELLKNPAILKYMLYDMMDY